MLRVSDIEGMPNITFGIPIGKDATESLMEEAGKLMNKAKAFNLNDLKEATGGVGQADS